MARVPNKHNRDQNLDFQGFLNDLQDWELSLKDKDKKLKSQSREDKKVGSSSQKIGLLGGDKGPTRKSPSRDFSSNGSHFEYTKTSDALNRISTSFLAEETPPDAASEKELGNEYFKKKMFKEAIDCYSRSIALSPTAVAFANRAMPYLKLKRFEQAENDCTEALNLDDRYIKAYSRRATARKELGKLKASFEDADFALRLEPDNQELKKQYSAAKAMYDKELLGRATKAVRNSTEEVQGVEGTARETDRIKEVEGPENKGRGEEPSGSQAGHTVNSHVVNSKSGNGITHKGEMKMSMQDLASRAASRVMAKADKNITPPKSAYQFEFDWRGLCGDLTLQARLLKAISPSTLPQLFKNALSASLLTEIIKCISTFFTEEAELAVKYLENLSKVQRFDMIIMCLSAADKSDLHKMWEETFSNQAVPINYAEILSELRPKYCPGGSGRVS